jgi:hypothetical protein
MPTAERYSMIVLIRLASLQPFDSRSLKLLILSFALNERRNGSSNIRISLLVGPCLYLRKYWSDVPQALRMAISTLDQRVHQEVSFMGRLGIQFKCRNAYENIESQQRELGESLSISNLSCLSSVRRSFTFFFLPSSLSLYQ